MAIYSFQIPGILNPGVDYAFPAVTGEIEVKNFTLGVRTAPGAGTLTVRLQNAAGDFPTQFIEATILAGQLVGTPVSGTITTSTGLHIKVVADNGAEWLNAVGEFTSEVSPTSAFLFFDWTGIVAQGDELVIPGPPFPARILDFRMRIAGTPPGTGSDFSLFADGAPAVALTQSFFPSTETTFLAATLPPDPGLVVNAGQAIRIKVDAALEAPQHVFGFFQVESLAVVDPCDLTTLARVKEYLRIVGVTSDNEIQEAITSASLEMQNYCGRKFNAADYVEIVDGGAFAHLFVSHPPLGVISGINAEGAWGVYDQVEDLANYKPDAGAGMILANTSVWRGDQSFEVSYRGGYETLPKDIEQAAVEQAAYTFNQSAHRGDRLGIETKTLDTNATVQYVVNRWAPGVKGILDHYKRWS